MKKLLLLLPIAALAPLLMTFLAAADPIPGAHYTGTVDVGGTVAFDVSADGTQVLSFTASNVPGTIPGAGGPCAFGVWTFPLPLDIASDAFGPGIQDLWELSGSFPGPSAAQGTLRLASQAVPGAPACDSDTVSWSATGEAPATSTPTPTTTPSPTATATRTATPTPTATATPTGTVTATPTATATATATATPTVTGTPTPTPTVTPSPTPTGTPTPPATPQFSVTPKTTAVPATTTPKAPPPTGARGDGGFGGLGLTLALLLAAGLLAGTASLIAFSFRRRA